MEFKVNPNIRDIDQHIAWIKDTFPKGNVWEMLNVLYYIAKNTKPKHYLEIGVFKGRSMALVLKASPQTKGYGVDVWETHSGFVTKPEEVISTLKEINIKKLPTLFSGRSQDLLHDLWYRGIIPDLLDLILVDGAHNAEDAKKDLELCIPHVKGGGVLLFHDIANLPKLADLVLSFKRKMPDFIFIESYNYCGFCLMIKLPFPWKILKRF